MDEEEIVNLINLSRQHNDEATEKLLQFFKPKVVAIAREYFLAGADFDDLLQEGMIGLYKAIQIYENLKNKNFKAFASMCIHRRLQNSVKLANRKKNYPLNEYLPIKYYDGSEVGEEDGILSCVIVDDNSDIEKLCIDKEMQMITLSKIKDLLKPNQFDLLKMFINGESYSSIATKMNITTKKVDNSLQQIKKQLKVLKGENK